MARGGPVPRTQPKMKSRRLSRGPSGRHRALDLLRALRRSADCPLLLSATFPTPQAPHPPFPRCAHRRRRRHRETLPAVAAASLLPSANDTGFIFPPEEREETSEEDPDEDDSCGGGCVSSASERQTAAALAPEGSRHTPPPPGPWAAAKQSPRRGARLSSARRKRKLSRPNGPAVSKARPTPLLPATALTAAPLPPCLPPAGAAPPRAAW